MDKVICADFLKEILKGVGVWEYYNMYMFEKDGMMCLVLRVAGKTFNMIFEDCKEMLEFCLFLMYWWHVDLINEALRNELEKNGLLGACCYYD